MYNKKEVIGRVYIADALRGISILLMVVYHMGYCLARSWIIPVYWIKNPVVDILQFIFASIFIMICGFSSRYSRNNFKRAAEILMCAVVVSVATRIFTAGKIIFGILHFLGFSILIYQLTRNLWDKISAGIQPWLYSVVFAVLYAVSEILSSPAYNHMLPPHLWVIGLPDAEFRSLDYFPIFPWFFMFLIGTWVGKKAKGGELPRWMYNCRFPFFEFIGRHTLVIYLIHQPIIQGIIYILKLIR